MSDKSLDEVFAESERLRDAELPEPGDMPEDVSVSRPNRARSTMLSVRLNADEYDDLRRYAEARGAPVSAVVRGFVLRGLRDGAEPVMPSRGLSLESLEQRVRRLEDAADSR